MWITNGLSKTALPRTSVASLNCCETARTSVPENLPRNGYADDRTQRPCSFFDGSWIGMWKFSMRTYILLTVDDLQLGTFGRAKLKVEELQRIITESRRTGAH